jgi:hypothetical protein
MPAREHAGGGQVVADVPQARHADPKPLSSSSAPSSRWSAALRDPLLIAVVASVALAALSAAVLPTVPSYDPWSWIVWGHEVFDPHLSFTVGGGPSWKPLPVMFTTVFGLFGSAAPTLWMITARAGGLLGLFGAWHLAGRLVGSFNTRMDGPSSKAVPAIAGLVAVLGVITTQDYFYYWFRGTSEPMLIATVVWAIDRFLDGKRAQAFLFAVAGALIRPEWWPFLGLYGLWLWFKEPRLRLLVLAGFFACPFFWFVPPWIGTGQPFIAATHAKEYNGHLGTHPELKALHRAADLQVLPVLIGAAVAVVWSWFRERDRTVLALGAGALVWIALVVVMVADGYPGLERFFLPASAILCVLAGVGYARLAAFVGGRLGGLVHGSDGHRVAALAGAATVLIAAVLVAISIPLASTRIDDARAARPTAERAEKTLNQLSAAVAAAGGRTGVLPCRSSLTAINHGVQTALAWKLGVTLERVQTVLRGPGVLFIGPHNSIDGGPAPVSRKLTIRKPIVRVGVWNVVRLTRPGARANSCAGR